MAASSAGPSLAQTLGLEVVLVLFILLRSYRVYQGRVLSVARLFLFPIVTTLLWVLAEGETALTIPWSYPIYTAVDVALVVASALVTLPLAGRLLSVYRGQDGQWMYRYGIELIAFYLAVWVVRLGLAVYYDPASLDFTFGPAPAISAVASVAMQLVQALFSVSTGLVVGRSVATYRMYRRAAVSPAPAAVPLP
jgi:hypothetical protein